MIKLKNIFLSLALVSAASFIGKAEASEDANTDDIYKEDYKDQGELLSELVKYDDACLDDLLIEEPTKPVAKKVSEKRFIPAEEYEKKSTHPDTVEATGSTAYATGDGNNPGKVSYPNYFEGILNDFDIRSENPDHIKGDYLDKFFESRSHYTPLKGYGDDIVECSNKYGINVGVFMGQIAKETTFGRDPAGGDYNFGSIRYTDGGYGSEYGYKMAAGSKWIDPPTVRDGIEITFKLMRENYADKGFTRYEDYLDRYSPSFENDQRSFERLALGTLNALNIPY